MSVQTLSFIFFNGITTAIFFKYAVKYVYEKVTKEKDEQMLWLLSKINKLETEVNELHETIDSLEETIQAKENLLKQSSDMLFSKIDNFIISNYDTVQTPQEE
jgi:predicted  nucleic acid-binding Zn-ribbon protein